MFIISSEFKVLITNLVFLDLVFSSWLSSLVQKTAPHPLSMNAYVVKHSLLDLALIVTGIMAISGFILSAFVTPYAFDFTRFKHAKHIPFLWQIQISPEFSAAKHRMIYTFATV